MKRQLVLWLATLGLTAVGPTAFAGESLIGAGGKPGVVSKWAAASGGLSLSIKDGFAPKAVAEAITKGVTGASAKVDGAKVQVSGVAEAKLLAALEKISVEPGMDDVDSSFAAIQNMGGEEEGSGSSIRASKPTDFSEVMKEQASLVVASVASVKQGKFPVAFVTVKVLELPAKGAPEGLKKGSTITVVARVRMSGSGGIDPSDAQSALNAGAWYARPGDKVALRLEGAVKDKKDTFLATSFERR